MSEYEDLERLIRLKRYEQPPEGYFEDFLNEFQRRQRSELLQRSSRSLFFERLGTYASGFGKETWMLGAGAGVAYAMLMVYFFVPSGDQPANQDAVAVEQHQTPQSEPVNLWRVNPDNLRIVPANTGTGVLPVSDFGTLQLDPAQQPESGEFQFAPRDF